MAHIIVVGALSNLEELYNSMIVFYYSYFFKLEGEGKKF